MGATFDPSGLYRFNAVMRWLADIDLTAAAIHTHAIALQRKFVAQLTPDMPLRADQLVVSVDQPARGNFLTFDMPAAAQLHQRLSELRVVTDVRGTRLRVGFGVYQTETEVAESLSRLRQL
jgi:kynureninase